MVASLSAADSTSRPLLIRTSRAPAAATDDPTAEEPVTPTARLMDDIYVVVTIGLGRPVNIPVLSTGIEAVVAQHPRLHSIQVTDGWKDGNPRWVRTAVNMDDHVVVTALDPAAVAADPDQALEDYVGSLSVLPMDRTRPLWEVHILDFPTSEAASTVAIRAHHSIGDGASMITLFVESTSRSATADVPVASLSVLAQQQPAAAAARRRTGAIYARGPRGPGVWGFVAWAWSYLVLGWRTTVDVVFFVATILFLTDPHTVFRRVDDGGGVFRRKRFVHRSLALDDVKFIKNFMKCTINDVLVGVTSAALSRYHFRKAGDTNTGNICLRSILVVNLRPATSLQTDVKLIESDKSNAVTWGNQLGYILLPFHLAMHDDPLAYVRKAKKTLDRKKGSLEVIFTHKITETFLKCFGLKAGGFIFRRMLENTTLLFSNMKGPAERVELHGHPVVFIAPSVYGTPEALVVHYQSYGSTIKVILSVDEDRFPDPRQLLDDFAESLRLIKYAASKLQTKITEQSTDN